MRNSLCGRSPESNASSTCQSRRRVSAPSETTSEASSAGRLKCAGARLCRVRIVGRACIARRSWMATQGGTAAGGASLCPFQSKTRDALQCFLSRHCWLATSKWIARRRTRQSPTENRTANYGSTEKMLTPANDNHPKYTGPHLPTKEAARELGARWFYTGNPCRQGHVAPRQSTDGKCAVCVWLSWEKVRRRKGKKPFQPNEAKRVAKENGERYFQGAVCPHGHDGLRWTHNGACVECTSAAADAHNKGPKGKEYRRIWNAANSDKVKENNRNTKAKRRGAEGKHTAKDIRMILKRQKFKCAECKTSVRSKKNRHVDHIMPIALGGSNWPSNIQILCPSCNLSKSARHPLDWAKINGRLV
ncbi:hypothetical protein GOB33_22315 [Sinorhizobium meliloti]|nr:hypothetical protein [Sinorhizobium meliloti]